MKRRDGKRTPQGKGADNAKRRKRIAELKKEYKAQRARGRYEKKFAAVEREEQKPRGAEYRPVKEYSRKQKTKKRSP